MGRIASASETVKRMSGRLLPNAVATSCTTKVRTKKSNASSVQPRKPARTALRWLARSAFVGTIACAAAVAIAAKDTTVMSNDSTNQPGRQPVHTVYGGAHLFVPDTTAKLGAIARRTLREYAPGAGALATALALDRDVAARIYPRIVEKLAREPVE